MSEKLDLQSVSVNFGGVQALSEVSFSLGKGEIVGLIGPNGAGKTTIFNVITGVYHPTAGMVTMGDACIARPKTRSMALDDLAAIGGLVIGGVRSLIRRASKKQKTGALRPHAILGMGIARTFQNIRLFPTMTAQENVMVSQHCRTKTGVVGAVLRLPSQKREEKRIRAKAMEELEFMGLADYAFQQAKNLSYGRQRALEIARALASNPRIILLDEPAAGLNPAESNELMRHIRRIVDRDVSVLLVEHDMKVVMGICRRIVVLDHGVKIAEGAPEEIQNNPKVVEAYLGQPAA